MPVIPPETYLREQLLRLDSVQASTVALTGLTRAVWAKVQAVDDAIQKQGAAWPPDVGLDVVNLGKCIADIQRFIQNVTNGMKQAYALGASSSLIPAGAGVVQLSPALIATTPRWLNLTWRRLPRLGVDIRAYVNAADSLPARLKIVEKGIDKLTGGSLPSAANILADWKKAGAA